MSKCLATTAVGSARPRFPNAETWIGPCRQETTDDAPTTEPEDEVDRPSTMIKTSAGRAWRIRRGLAQANRLRTEASILVRVLGGAVHGTDPILDHAASFVGLGPDAVSCLRIDIRGRSISLLLPTNRTWRHVVLRRHLSSLSVRAAAAGRAVHVVDPAVVGRRPRITVGRRILQIALPASDDDRRRIIEVLVAAGGVATLGACCSALSPAAAERRVLGLVIDGSIGIGMNQPLGPESRIWLRSVSGMCKTPNSKEPSHAEA